MDKRRGLTLVELLLAIVIVTLILGAAYTVSSMTLNARTRYSEANSAEAVLNALETLLRRDFAALPLKNREAKIIWEQNHSGQRELHLTAYAAKGSREGMLCEIIYRMVPADRGGTLYRLERKWSEGRTTKWGVDSSLSDADGAKVKLGTYEEFRWFYSATGNENTWNASALVYNASQLSGEREGESDDDAPDNIYGITFQITTLSAGEHEAGVSRMIQISFSGNSLYVINH